MSHPNGPGKLTHCTPSYLKRVIFQDSGKRNLDGPIRPEACPDQYSLAAFR
jgi:hypothetical protein